MVRRSVALFGMARLKLAVVPVPTISMLASGLTRAWQPGAPKGVRSKGSGPAAEVVRLKPKMKMPTPTGRLLITAVIVVFRRGNDVAVLPGMPRGPAQPAPKK